MEDVLSVYQQPITEEYPLVCMDETSKQQVMETRIPLPGRAGDVEKYEGLDNFREYFLSVE